MNDNFNYCHVAELTDKGCKRSVNEDWLTHFRSPNGLVAVVCDGMGGHVGGRTASHTAVEAIQLFMMQERNGSPSELIVEALNVASAAILNKAAQQPELTGMGSTCVMLIVRDGKVYIGSVGDSRVYLIRNHKILQLTKDQSYVQMLVDAGTITPEQAEHHPRKNEITNALGLKGMQPATVLPEAINPEAGDCFLLCSDGLSGMVSDNDICKVVSRQSDKTQQERVEELVQRAKRNGGIDNISCQIVEFSVSPNNKIQSRFKINNWSLIGIGVVILLLIGFILWFLHKIQLKEQEIEHSETVSQLIATVDSVFTLGKIQYTKGDVFLEITEDKDFGGIKIQEKLSNGDSTVIIMGKFSLKKIEITPKECISINYYSLDSTKCTLSFVKELGTEQEVTIKFQGEMDYLYIIPIIKPKPTTDFSGTNRGAKKGMSEKTYDDKPIFTSKDSVLDVRIVTIHNELENQKIILKAHQGTDSATILFFPEYQFKNLTEVHDENWYTISSDSSQCTITIKNTAIAPIPMTDPNIFVPIQQKNGSEKKIVIKIIKGDSV